MKTNFSGALIRKVIRMSTFVRTSSRVGISTAGASNGVSRVVTMWLTMIHGMTKWLPGPRVRSNRPRWRRTACEPSGTGTRNDWKTPRTISRAPIPRAPPRIASWRSSSTAEHGDDQAGDHELVADPQGLLGQDDDRQAARGVGRRQRIGGVQERNPDLGQLDPERGRPGAGLPGAPRGRRGRDGGLGGDVVGHRFKPLLGQGWAAGAMAGGGVEVAVIGGGGRPRR